MGHVHERNLTVRNDHFSVATARLTKRWNPCRVLLCAPKEQVRQAYEATANRYIELFANSTDVHADDLGLITRHLSIRPVSCSMWAVGPGTGREKTTEHPVRFQRAS